MHGHVCTTHCTVHSVPPCGHGLETHEHELGICGAHYQVGIEPFWRILSMGGLRTELAKSYRGTQDILSRMMHCMGF